MRGSQSSDTFIAMMSDEPIELDPAQTPSSAAEQAQPTVADQQFNAAERQQLLALARSALEAAVRTGELPEPDISDFPPAFALPGACFVTLTRHGQLRGCIGNLVPRLPLYRAIQENARAAALNDYRFDRVAPEELEDIAIEISVLTEPKPLSFTSPEELLDRLRPNRDGVILRLGHQSATFLPQVWEKMADKATFLSQLARKAGCASDAWREPGTTVETYEVEAFEEAESPTDGASCQEM